MVRKFCPRCKTYSYSAAYENEWICPGCRMDLTAEPALQLQEEAEAAKDRESVNVDLIQT